MLITQRPILSVPAIYAHAVSLDIGTDFLELAIIPPSSILAMMLATGESYLLSPLPGSVIDSGSSIEDTVDIFCGSKNDATIA
jgi:hypothetical protein